MSCNHHLSELTVNSFKYFSIFGKLLPNIFRPNEDIHQNTPILLHLQPLIYNYIHSSKLLSPTLNCCNKILYILALCLHSHQIERVSIKYFHHIVESCEDEILFISIKSEDLLGPVAFNDLELLINLELFLSNINDFFNFRF